MQPTQSTQSMQLDDDGAPVGRLLTRREALALLGTTAGGAILAACLPGATATPGTGGSSASATASATGIAVAVPSCIVRPELTEGPYFVDEKLNRSDIRADSATGEQRPGVPFALAFAVSRLDGSTCTAFEGALVDVWHCDALGEYSDVQANVGQDWLRGYQVTDASGAASFTTIYPGWYQGRAVHLHFKIRTDAGADAGLEFTSQLFLDEAVTAAVYARDPYASKGPADVPNGSDGIYNQGGDQLLLTPGAQGDGYTATLEIGIQVA
ncbi:MAG TPA: intradiol ring-cleavage dioxygenase [Candidatus Limnocylindria bacterium]